MSLPTGKCWPSNVRCLPVCPVLLCCNLPKVPTDLNQMVEQKRIVTFSKGGNLQWKAPASKPMTILHVRNVREMTSCPKDLLVAPPFAMMSSIGKSCTVDVLILAP